MDADGDGSPASEDCDDTRADIFPGAAEILYDGIDNDCDPETSDDDADGDGFSATEVGGEDCDDGDPNINPAASESSAMDGIDQNCDGIDGDAATICDSPNLTMAFILNGIFTMGSPEEEVGRKSDETQHAVTLTHPFCAAATEVTQGQYAALMGDSPSHFDTCGDDCPVEEVSWNMAAAYANALSDNEGMEDCYSCTGSGADTICSEVEAPYLCEGYRLPTEAEWEYAARGGLTDEAFPNGGSLQFGTTYDCSDPKVELNDGPNLADQAWYCGNSDDTQPVGQLLENAYGLYDMAGNVWEWTEDWYGDYGADAVDPAGAVSGTDRVIRGGSWNDDPRSVRVATRDSRGPSNQNIYVGFRLARSLAALPWSQGVPPIPSSSTSNCSAAPPGMVGGWPSSP